MMNTMGGGDDLPDLDGVEDVRITILEHLSALSSYSMFKMFYEADVKSVSVSIKAELIFFCPLRTILQIVMMRVSIYECLVK